MRDLWHLFRGSIPRLESLSCAFEKSGLTLEGEPIPWCAGSVLIGAVVEMPSQAPRSKGDFELHVGGDSWLPESQRADAALDSLRLQFRLPVPGQAAVADLTWRGRSLGQLSLPLLKSEEFVKRLSLNKVLASVRLGEETVACHTYVARQCQGLVVAGLLESPTSLAPILDLGLRVELRHGDGGPVVSSAAIRLCASQLRSRQTLVTGLLPKPKRMGSWQITWHAGDRLLATYALKAISQKQLLRSLRVSSTRFILQNKRGEIRIERFLPDLKGVARVGPCFLVSSGETGMAGWCSLEVRARMKGTQIPPPLREQEVLITDGSFPFAPGTLEVGELERVKHFELWCEGTMLGTLALTPVPTAAFTQEGGFAAPDAFDWTNTAEEQLHERLGKLMKGHL